MTSIFLDEELNTLIKELKEEDNLFMFSCFF
jgi:hypothetical protein